MEFRPKSAQELLAQAESANPYFSDFLMPEEEATRLNEQARAMRDDIRGYDVYESSDEELSVALEAAWQQADENGILRADKGESAAARMAYAAAQNERYGYAIDEAREKAAQDLKKSGYIDAVRQSRQDQERRYKDPIDKYIKDHEISVDKERAELDLILETVIDTGTLTEKESMEMSRVFPSGNFMYHGAGTEQLVGMLDSGALMNFKALQERENTLAASEGREPDMLRRNSGYEGVSWSMNTIDGLPGDRYHLAGFMVAPEVALGTDQQLAIPSRPAPSEVLQISAEVDASALYDAKTQVELYRDFGMLGESNSVFSNLLAVAKLRKGQSEGLQGEPMLYSAKNEAPEYQEQLRSLYTITDRGNIRLNPDLLQQTGEQTPVAAVWLRAAIDTGRFSGTHLEGKELSVVIDELDEATCRELISMGRQDSEQYEKLLEQSDSTAGSIEVPVEDMYFVAPRKDAETWLRVLARSAHKPAGVVLYDDKKVRLENFASSHRGDQGALTKEIGKVVSADNPDYISYSQVLGAEFDDSMRAGSRRQVIGEGYLVNRGTIKKENNKLIIDR